MKKIKILYTIPNFDTAGSGKALLNIALGLDKSKFEPHILCLHDRGAFFETVKKSGIPIHIFDYLPKERPVLKMFLACWKVSRKLKSINPDIIHSFHYSSNYTEALAARMAGVLWTFTKKNMSWGGSSANSWKLRSLLAKKIIVQNTDMLKQFYPNSKKTNLISRGVVVENFSKSEPLPEIKTKMQTELDQRVLICVANFVPVKGIETLIKAFVLIHEVNPQWVLWLVGDVENQYGEMLQNLVVELDLTHKIKFSGKQLNIKPYLDHAEVFVLPTLDEGRKEGSPVALLEAMANGKVVLGSRVSGVKDQLFDYQDYQFTANDVDGLSKKLDFLLKETPDNLQKMGKQFSALVEAHYSISTEIEKHQQHYLTMI